MTAAAPSASPLMRTSITTFETRLRQRFHTLAYHAAYHARPGEAAKVDRLVVLVQAGHISYRDGHAALAALRRDQTREAA